jgi:hypothetical protein
MNGAGDGSGTAIPAAMVLADNGGEEAPRPGDRRPHLCLILARPETVRGVPATCTGGPAAAAMPATANDGAGKEAAQMENDEVELLVVLARGAGAWSGRSTRRRGALLQQTAWQRASKRDRQ